MKVSDGHRIPAVSPYCRIRCPSLISRPVYTVAIMFGKSLSAYVRFQRWILILIVLAFAIRLGASLAGVPNEATKWISVNLALFVGLLYCSVAVHTRGFGSYKQLFGLLLVQTFVAEILIALAIVFGILTATDSIYTAPEYFGGNDGKTWVHVLLHLVGWIPGALFGWLFGSLILLVTRRLKPNTSR
jgi:hypothetical protein